MNHEWTTYPASVKVKARYRMVIFDHGNPVPGVHLTRIPNTD